MTDLPEPFPEEGSPFQDLLRYRVTRWEDGFAEIRQTLGPSLGNRSGIPHGGVYATLLDTVMGYAGCWSGDPAVRRAAVTLSLTVNFLAPPKGSQLIGEGRLTGGGKRSYFTDGRLVDDTGLLIATATGVFRRIG